MVLCQGAWRGHLHRDFHHRQPQRHQCHPRSYSDNLPVSCIAETTPAKSCWNGGSGARSDNSSPPNPQ
ncbi:hypothetical protein MLD38_040088 [Melastoma candidum]|uniref:Uncharacterized protein n=1 Tax=Melastoma candidum TaxID=119954 RepID=A0ACB9L6G2_9MYRT|nr:hypothetical protein MLD38_040088 [Melastoma candidum]